VNDNDKLRWNTVFYEEKYLDMTAGKEGSIMKLENLAPKRVFYYFEEINNIPRGSGDTKRISDYIKEFGEKHGLRTIQEECGNVIIFKDASKGYENVPPVILQGHMDMVCEKESGCTHDFETEGLDLMIDGDFIRANGTTLGADDGIAVAYMMAVLEDDTLEHPPLEAVFTVDEEIGLLGAKALDASVLKGTKMLNIDSEEDGIFLTSCAGGMTYTSTLPMERQASSVKDAVTLNLHIYDLLGGHSGTEIEKERANVILLFGHILQTLRQQFSYELADIHGGLKDNAIAREGFASFVIEKDQEQIFKLAFHSMFETIRSEFAASDPNMKYEWETKAGVEGAVLSAESLTKVIFYLTQIPNGVIHRSVLIKDLVETSLNAGIMQLKEDHFTVVHSIRSSVTSRKNALANRISTLVVHLDGTYDIRGDYPAWEYQEDSALREIMCDAYRDLSGKEPVVQAIHAGLECGLFSGKIPGLDAISFGPQMYDIHTPSERLNIASVGRTYELILEVLKRIHE
jgi:dipeptidase D